MLSQGSKTSTMVLFIMPVLAVFIFSHLAYVDCVLPQDDWVRPVMVKRQFKVCGSQINQALNLLCEAHASPHPEDSMEEPRKRAFGMVNYVPAMNPMRLPYFKKQAALSMLGNGGFVRISRGGILTGIADECCYKTCTIDELTAYCAVERTNARTRFNV